MSTFNTNPKTARNISWTEGIDPETEDRLAYLALSSKEKWDYLMTLILATYPPGKKVTFNNRTIEWT
jgi:hypothetical protein